MVDIELHLFLSTNNSNNFDMDVVEMAKDIVATLEDFIKFAEPNEVDESYAERIKESYELLVE